MGSIGVKWELRSYNTRCRSNSEGPMLSMLAKPESQISVLDRSNWDYHR